MMIESAPQDSLPSAMACFDEIFSTASERRVVLFLDYDGTLTPIVERPDQATLSDGMRALLLRLSRRFVVAIVSGRARQDVMSCVGLDGLYYIGSHGFDIGGSEGLPLEHHEGAAFVPLFRQVERELRALASAYDGLLVENKTYGVAVHFRMVAVECEDAVRRTVRDIASKHPELRVVAGKKVLDLLPAVSWDKGMAVRWMLERLDPTGDTTLPVYVGDDRTDETAFSALRGRGAGILVAAQPRQTSAGFLLHDVTEVGTFLTRVLRLRRGVERKS